MKEIQYFPIIFFVLVLMLLVVIAAVIALFRIRIHPKKTETVTEAFDERQVLARNAAYKVAFYLLVAYCTCCVLLYVFGFVWADIAAQMLIGIGVSGTAFSVICIAKDAYLRFNDKRRWWKVAFSAFCVAFCWLNCARLQWGEPVKDADIVYVVYSLCCIVVGTAATVKEIRANRSRIRK